MRNVALLVGFRDSGFSLRVVAWLLSMGMGTPYIPPT